jgi:RNA polymerase sigma-70 factor (ECF subfamily)
MSAVASGQRQSHARVRTAVEDRARQDDAVLVRRCRAGDASAWPVLVDRFSSYVYAITIGFGLSGDRAEDVFQEVFTRVFTRLDSLRDEGALKPWIAQLTRRAAIDRLRADRRELPALADSGVADEDPYFERLELAMTVQRALAELPAAFGEALTRFFLEDESYRAIAEALDVPAGTVASRISRGLSMLRAVLDSDGASAIPDGTADA